MARIKDKEKALVYRRQGLSYSQIRNKLNVSKSTLSGWLAKYPLSEKRLRELRDFNPKRIEKYRNTMSAKKNSRLKEVYEKISKDIGEFSKRDIFLAGLFLYWGEGTKAQNSCVALTNTNPSMILFFINWLKLFGINTKALRIRIHLYSDMNLKQTLDFWSKKLKLPLNQFTKPYIKKTKLNSLSYKNGFGKGTCSVILGSRDLWEYITMGLKYIAEKAEI